jgi:hypothetical protein
VDVEVASVEVLSIKVRRLTLPTACLLRAIVDGNSLGTLHWFVSTIVVHYLAVLIAHQLGVVRGHPERAEARRAHTRLCRNSGVFKSLLLAKAAEEQFVVFLMFVVCLSDV